LPEIPMKQYWVWTATSIFLFGAMVSLTFAVDLFRFAYTPLFTTGQDIQFELLPGTSLKQFASQLVKVGVLGSENKNKFVYLARVRGDAPHLQSGEYRFRSGSSARKLLRKIRKGHIYYHRITFPEGWRFAKMKKRLSEDGSLKQTLMNLSDSDIMHSLLLQKGSLEGIFYPDTYFFSKGTEDRIILQNAHKKMQDILVHEWQRRADGGLYKTPYQALIVASMIEKETAHDKERYLIASVIANRLQRNMPLQIDPTVIYALGDAHKDKLKRSDLNVDSPYNTYLHKGLPPTPIGMSSQKSIHAALQPLKTNYIYYVAQADGTHMFALTLVQHNQNIQQVKHVVEVQNG